MNLSMFLFYKEILKRILFCGLEQEREACFNNIIPQTFDSFRLFDNTTFNNRK